MNTDFLNMVIFDLQVFATETQTTEKNATGNDLSPGMVKFYDKALLDNASPNLVYDQFAQKRNIPKNGGKTIQFRKFTPFAKAVTALTEGVTPDGNTLDQKEITATIAQYGDYTMISDLLDMTHLDPIMAETVKLHGAQAGVSLDTITREVVCAGTNVMFAPKNAGGTITPVSTRATMDITSLITLDMIFDAAAWLKAQNTPKIDGSYVAILHPYVARDLMVAAKDDGSWIDVNKYSNATNIFEGELGKIGGVRFVESSEAKLINDNTCPANGSGKYLTVAATVVLGANAYATTAVEGGGLRTIVKQLGSAGTADPLDQRATIGWKSNKVAVRLEEAWMVRLESCFSKSASVGGN